MGLIGFPAGVATGLLIAVVAGISFDLAGAFVWGVFGSLTVLWIAERRKRVPTIEEARKPISLDPSHTDEPGGKKKQPSFQR